MSQSFQNAFILQSFGVNQRDEGNAWAPPVHAGASSSATPASPRREYKPGCPPKVKYDEQGNETYEWAWYQSVERLRSTWEGIMKRYSEAHFEDQDEIYLGRPNVPGDEPRLIRDRGSLRALRNRSSLDQFMHEELPHYGEGEEEEAGETTPRQASPAPSAPRGMMRVRAFDEDDEDLQEFLRQEARRREVLGDEEEEEVVDLRDYEGAAETAAPREAAEPGRVAETPEAAGEAAEAPAPASRSIRRAPSPDADVAVELDIYRSVKREAVEQLLRADALGTSAIPYDVPGLSAMLASYASTHA